MSTGTYSASLVASKRFRGLWLYRELLRNLVERDIKVRYKRSVLGFAWMLLNPLITMIVFTVIFREVFKMEQDYALYVISALLLYNFFSLGSSQGLNSVVVSGALIRKVWVPKAIFPLASVCANFINFGLSLIPLAAVMVFTGAKATPALLILPIPIAAAFLFTFGVSLVLATLNVFYRDVRWFYDSVLLILFYMTPIIYPAKVVPEQFRAVLKVNPLTWLLDAFRMPIYEGRVPPASDLLVCVGLGVGMLWLGWLVFHRYEDRFINYV
ncbi:MAG TPA: ABC transporter permease [Blastocatellia bacterium]|nr:ABC transporter permease [Blastocatellia bacterium]